MEEFRLMLDDPRTLFDRYINQMIAGTPLTLEQQIRFAYLRTLFVIDEENNV